MNVAQYVAHQAATYEKCLETTKRKSADYAGDANPFANFALVEALGLCDVTTGVLVRMSDKLSRICNLTRPGREAQVKDESI